MTSKMTIGACLLLLGSILLMTESSPINSAIGLRIRRDANATSSTIAPAAATNDTAADEVRALSSGYISKDGKFRIPNGKGLINFMLLTPRDKRISFCRGYLSALKLKGHVGVDYGNGYNEYGYSSEDSSSESDEHSSSGSDSDSNSSGSHSDSNSSSGSHSDSGSDSSSQSEQHSGAYGGPNNEIIIEGHSSETIEIKESSSGSSGSSDESNENNHSSGSNSGSSSESKSSEGSSGSSESKNSHSSSGSSESKDSHSSSGSNSGSSESNSGSDSKSSDSKSSGSSSEETIEIKESLSIEIKEKPHHSGYHHKFPEHGMFLPDFKDKKVFRHKGKWIIANVFGDNEKGKSGLKTTFPVSLPAYCKILIAKEL